MSRYGSKLSSMVWLEKARRQSNSGNYGCNFGRGTRHCTDEVWEHMKLKVGKGNRISFWFWFDSWASEEPFVVIFLELYQMCRLKVGMVSYLRADYEGFIQWNLHFKGSPFERQVTPVASFIQILESVSLSAGV